MNLLIGNVMIKSQPNAYSKIEHAKLLAGIIKRMANNHMKWLFSLISIIAFGITMDKFFLGLQNKNLKITTLIISMVITLMLESLSMKLSKNFLELEKGFRNKQELVLNDQCNDYNMNPIIKKEKTSWIIKAGYALIILSLLIDISLIIVALLFP